MRLWVMAAVSAAGLAIGLAVVLLVLHVGPASPRYLTAGEARALNQGQQAIQEVQQQQAMAANPGQFGLTPEEGQVCSAVPSNAGCPGEPWGPPAPPGWIIPKVDTYGMNPQNPQQ